MEDRQVRQLVARADTLLNKLESMEDSEARAVAIETIQVLFEMYGEGLARMVDQAGSVNALNLIEVYKHDELLSHLLLMHGLHPETVVTRIQQALDEVRPYMETHGGNVELLGVEGGIAHLRLVGSCNGCAASSVTMKLAVERAVQKFAPELLGIKAEGAVDLPADSRAGFIPAPSLGVAEGIKQDG